MDGYIAVRLTNQSLYNILAKVPMLDNSNGLPFYIASRLIDKANLIILMKKKNPKTLLKVVTKE